MRNRKRLVSNLIIFILVLVASLSAYLYFRLDKVQYYSQDGKELRKNSDILKEKNSLISDIRDIYLFPDKEEPTLATVSDPALLKDKNFFKNPLKGDKVLIFSKAGKAVLYRPDIGKIVEIVTIENNYNKTEKIEENSKVKNKKTTLP